MTDAGAEKGDPQIPKESVTMSNGGFHLQPEDLLTVALLVWYLLKLV